MSTNRPPLRYSASPVNSYTSVTTMPAFSSGSISEYVNHCESLCSGSIAIRWNRLRAAPDAASSPLAKLRPDAVDPARSDLGPRASVSQNRGGGQLSVRCSRAQRIEQAARPRRVRDGKQIGPRLHDRTEPIQQCGTSFRAEQLVGFGNLKRAPTWFGCPTAPQRGRVRSEGVARMLRQGHPLSNQRKLASASPSERATSSPVRHPDNAIRPLPPRPVAPRLLPDRKRRAPRRLVLFQCALPTIPSHRSRPSKTK